ncbi:MAG: hypothetical protein AB7O45_11890 [Alphaproteobacteria bacterium]
MGRHRSKGGHGKRWGFSGGGHGGGHGGHQWRAPPQGGHDATPAWDRRGTAPPPVGSGPRRAPAGATAIALALVVAVAWSLLAWATYAGGDAILDWTRRNAGGIVQAGKDAATSAGVGKEVVGAATSPGVTGAVDQGLGVLDAALRPAIIVIWLLGLVSILAAPFVLRRFGRFGRFGH